MRVIHTSSRPRPKFLSHKPQTRMPGFPLSRTLALFNLISRKACLDSLFMEKGFGTLDRQILNILNASGKPLA